MPVTRTNKHRALPLQEVELDGWFLILYIVLDTCTIWFVHKFYMSFVFRFHILELMSWIWTTPSTKGLKFESPSKGNSYEGFNIDHRLPCPRHTYQPIWQGPTPYWSTPSPNLRCTRDAILSLFVVSTYTCPLRRWKHIELYHTL